MKEFDINNIASQLETSPKLRKHLHIRFIRNASAKSFLPCKIGHSQILDLTEKALSNDSFIPGLNRARESIKNDHFVNKELLLKLSDLEWFKIATETELSELAKEIIVHQWS